MQSKLLALYCLLFYPLVATIYLRVRLFHCTKGGPMNEVCIYIYFYIHTLNDA